MIPPEADLVKSIRSPEPQGTVPVGVPVSVAERCRSAALYDARSRETLRKIRKSPNVFDLGLAPVTPEAAGSSPVDPANILHANHLASSAIVKTSGEIAGGREGESAFA